MSNPIQRASKGDTPPAAFLEQRGRTAIRRHRCSKPIALAIAQGLVSRTTTVFDYGCGHGGDLAFLKRKKISAKGWDPNHRPKDKREAADVVNLGYVLNVIEDIQERVETLQAAFELASKVLIVSVRVDNALQSSQEYADGLLTGHGTFQKIFAQSEFLDFVKAVLARRPHPVAPGIAYVFKDEQAEADYLATRAFSRRLEYRTHLVDEFSKSAVAKRFVRLANKLGRMPLEEEFKDSPKLREAFGSWDRVQRLTLRHIDEDAFEGSREQRREDILTYLAMLRFQNVKAPKVSLLPKSVQADIKALWTNFGEARKDGDAFLFSLGDPDAVKAACKAASIGKLLPADLYVHRTAEDELPALLRLVLFAAGLIVGDVGYDLVKISLDGRAVSFLSYPDFDEDPHPALARSVRVYLPRATYGVRDYGGYASPPILHRKETLVAKSYPHFDQFRRLTEQEDEAGLLSHSEIGFLEAWNTLLEATGYQLSGHELELRMAG